MENNCRDDLPLVSAVIPTRNRPDLVCRAIRSALNQSYSNLEVVVVVDGPDPVTVEILKVLREPRLRIVALPENVGGGEARNIGVREARGEFIALLDDDDEWLPEKTTKQLSAFLEADSEDCLVASRYISRTPGQKDNVFPVRGPQANEPLSEWMFYAPGFQCPIRGAPTPSYFALKELFILVPFRKGLKCHQDWDWFLRVMSNLNMNFLLLEEPLCVIHYDPNRSSVGKSIHWKDSLEWVDSSSSLFTARAYSSFITHICMPRCADTNNRLAAFRLMLRKCRKSTRLSVSQIILALKWYVLSPRIRRFIKQQLL